MEKEKMPMMLFSYQIPSKDIKISKKYLASDGWRWYIDVADYGWVISNAPGYESYTRDGYKNDLGYEKNFEEAYQWLLDVCKRNDWTLKEIGTPEEEEEIVLDDEECNLDINRSLYNIENRKIYEYDDDIATLFYKGYKVAKGTTERFRCNWCEEVSYCKDMNDFLDDIGIELAIELDDEDVKDNWQHIWDELEWNEESKSYKYKNWEWIVLDL